MPQLIDQDVGGDGVPDVEEQGGQGGPGSAPSQRDHGPAPAHLERSENGELQPGRA